MKKSFKHYLSVWAILLVVFNILVFIPFEIFGIDEITPSFLIGYIFITLSFIGQLACARTSLKEENLSKFFYSLPIVTISYYSLILAIIAGGLCMLIPLPWLGVLLCTIIFGFNAIAVGQAIASSDIVSAIDDKVKVETFFIKSFTVDAYTLMGKAKTEESKSECRKVYEAARYSIPRGNPALVPLEGEITIKFEKLTQAVEDNNLTQIQGLATEIVILLKDRNKKCQLLQ